MNSYKTLTVTSITSVLLSFLASSHHFLHRSILFLLGGSTNMMATMSSFSWILVMTVASIMLSISIL
jgi:hypothetical protein